MNTQTPPDKMTLEETKEILSQIAPNSGPSLRAILSSALSLLEGAQADKGWQPIETAPRDGICILAMLPDSDVPAIIRGNNAEHMDFSPTWQVAWDAEHLGKFDQPTHWMPLPSPPVSPHGSTNRGRTAMKTEEVKKQEASTEAGHTRYRAFTLPEFLEALGGCHVSPTFNSQEEYDQFWEQVQDCLK